MRTTAIIPCYNASPFLGEALESVLRQTRALDELIVVDDCSTDDSRKIAKRYPVRLLTTPRNSGHAAARNVGIAAARGDVLVWLDADDYFEPNHVETVCGLLERHPRADVAFTCVRRFGTKSGLLGRTSPCCGTPRSIFRECLRRTVVPAMSVATRTGPIRHIGGFNADIRIAPDFDLWLRMSLRHLFVSSDDVTVNYRCHPGQISARPLLQWRSVYESRLRLYQQLRADNQLELAQHVGRQILEIWEAELKADWRRRDMQLLNFHLSLSNLVPGASRVASRLKRRVADPNPVMYALKWVTAVCGKNQTSIAPPSDHAHAVDNP